MHFLILLIVFYTLFKLLFVLAHTDYTQLYLFQNKIEFFKFFINPLLNKKYSKDKYLSIYYYLSLVLVLSWTLILSFRFSNLVDILKINFSIGLIYILAIFIFVGFLLYLSIYDVMSFSIPELISKRMLLFVISVNILFLLLRIFSTNQEYSYIFGLINLGSISNIIGGLLGGGIIWIIVKLSGEKAMGSGDVDILASIGFFVAVPGIFYSIFYTLMAASIISVIYVLLIRKYKGVLIPFVPFLATGFILSLAFTDTIVRIFSLY